jgi:hypothetical protein
MDAGLVLVVRVELRLRPRLDVVEWGVARLRAEMSAVICGWRARIWRSIAAGTGR